MKKSFLTSLSILAATMAADAKATLPQAVADKIPSSPSHSLEQASTQAPFVLNKPNEHGLFVAAHSSHASHSSHRSHFSSR